MSEPKFKEGDILRPTIRGLDHNIGVVEIVMESDHTKGLWMYYVRLQKTGDLWPFRENQIEYAPILDAMASL